MSEALQALLLELLDGEGGRSLAPEAVARAAAALGGGAQEDWRRWLAPVRAAAVALARQGRLEVLRHGRPADPESFKGVYRLRRREG